MLLSSSSIAPTICPDCRPGQAVLRLRGLPVSRLANSMAWQRPMPPPAPVTAATLPWNSLSERSLIMALLNAVFVSMLAATQARMSYLP